MEAAEQAALRARQQAEREQEIAAERQAERQQAQLLQEQTENCVNEGGTPTTITEYGQTYFACRAPFGGLLPVYPPGNG